MSVCPKPDAVTKTAVGEPAKATVNPPAQRTESCNASVTTVVAGSGGNTTTEVVTQGPPGPQGAAGEDVNEDVFGFKWEGEWAAGSVYVKQSHEHRNGSVVHRAGRAWMCIQDHISEDKDGPVDPNSTDVSEAAFYWELLAGNTAQSVLIPEEKDWLDKLIDFKDGIFDWIENADLGDWLKAGAIAAGVIWAGSKISDMMAGDGEDVDADQKYTGSDGLDNGSYVGSDGQPGVYIAPKLKTVLTSLCTYSNISFDVSAISDGDTCEFTVGSASSIRSILEQLSLAYQFDMVNSGGILKFIPKHTNAVQTITLEDMGFSANSNPPPPYTAKRFQGIDLPRSVNLTYFAADMDYNQFTQSSELFTYTDGQNVTLTVPVTLSHAKAKQIADVAIVNAHLERMNYKFSTTYKFINVEPGDVLNSPMGLIRIVRVSETSEGVLEFEACDAGDSAALVGSSLPPVIPTPSTNIPVSIGKSQAFWIDPTNLDDQDTSIRIYAAVHGYGKAGWPGATIWMSEDGGNTYDQIGSTNKEATVGIVETAAQPAQWQTWDMNTQIVVKLKTGTLLPMSELAVLNGANSAQIGQELISFCNAELIGPKTYRLSKLMRGRQGTEQYISTHADNELFCLMDSSLVRIELAEADRGTTKQFKVVTNGSSLDVVAEDNVQIISNNTRMWQVYDPKVTLKTNGDWNVTFKERVRFNNGLQDFTTTMHDDDFGGFGVAVLDLSNATKSTQVVLQPSFTYTTAQQITDFGTAQNQLRVSVVTMSKKWGGGYPLIINS